jgi:hypothetical protein
MIQLNTLVLSWPASSFTYAGRTTFIMYNCRYNNGCLRLSKIKVNIVWESFGMRNPDVFISYL